MSLDALLGSGGLVVVIIMLSSGFALGKFFDIVVSRALVAVAGRGR